jgi:glycosyltransferase involved in cell wall biosynthesis/GT2 family glycosyltransferase
MRVSVVICTYNRADSLGATLESLTHQRHADLEVVVVNGPSTDHTLDVLLPWVDRVKVQHCPAANLSMSRNIGIRAAAGEIVAFIDDDALPDFEWLTQALPAFDDPGVGGVGGIVFDHTGMDLQYRYSAANRFGETESSTDQPYDVQCAPGSFQFPYLQGTNALFRRSALEEVGGFDEVFEYFHDETDLCCRLVDAGFLLRQLPDAAVHHKFLPSGIRNHHRVVTNWFPIVKNQTYFAYRHAWDDFPEVEIHERTRRFIQSRIDDAQAHEDAGRLPAGSARRCAERCAEAFSAGLKLGHERHRVRLGPVTWPAPDWKPFPTVDASQRRAITFVSSGYTNNMTGGIARFISDLAPALARRGHEVRVVTRAVGPPAVDLEQGVWVHRIDAPPAGAGGVAPDVLAHVNDFATAAVNELERINLWGSHDLVYGPLWDVEVLGALRRTALPVVVQVATPLAIAAEMAGHLGDDESAATMRRLMALEDEVLRLGDLFHANSSAVADTITTHYGATQHGATQHGAALDPARWQVVHLGLVDWGAQAPAPRPTGAAMRVVFVGRFEVRKGIDTLLAAVARLAPELPDVEFVLAGEDRPLAPGEALCGAAWAAAHADQPWAARVQFPGAVSDEELHALYASADLVVLPSRYESFGLVMAEAMIHGRALISCDTSGIRDVVRDGVDGVLVAPGEMDALTDAMRALLADPARRAALGAAGRARFVEAFHVDRFAARFDRFVARIGRVGAPTWLRTGEVVTLAVEPGAVARVVVGAQVPATITITDGRGARTEVVGPGAVHRLAADTSAGSITVAAVHGDVVVHGAVTVAAEGSR